MRIRYRTRASHYAAAERRAQYERDEGIEDRHEEDKRVTWWLDLRPVGGPWWRCEPRRGYVSYRVIDEATGALVLCAPPKTILDEARKLLPRVRSERY